MVAVLQVMAGAEAVPTEALAEVGIRMAAGIRPAVVADIRRGVGIRQGVDIRPAVDIHPVVAIRVVDIAKHEWRGVIGTSPRSCCK